MNKVKIIALVGSVCVLLFALASPKLGKKQKMEMVDVIMTSHDIKKNSVLTADDLQTVKYPKELAPETLILDKEEAIGLVSHHDLGDKELLTQAKLFKPGSKESGIGFLIPKGQRAITLDVQAATGMAGLLKPKDKVDVITVIDNKEAYVILENKEVLAVDRDFFDTDNKENAKEMYVTITIAVTLQEAVNLSLSNEMGVNRVVLRNPTDDSKTGALEARK